MLELSLDLGLDLFTRLEPPELVAERFFGPQDLVLFPALSGLAGDEHVPQPVRVPVEHAAGFAILAGGSLFSGCRAVIGPVLEAGAAESFMFAHIARQLASSASPGSFRSCAVGCRHSEAGDADVVENVVIPLDSAVVAPERAATYRAKSGVLGAAGANAGDNIDIASEAAPRAPSRALAGGGKAGTDFVACGAHLAFQVDIPLDPAPRAVDGLATNRAKRRMISTPALLAHNIHILRHAAPAAPERALGTRGGKAWHIFIAR
jgi:hypothetical protein